MGAVFSKDGVYRYRLSRDLLDGEGKVMFVMLNPSIADAQQDDPTIRRCIGFARRWGFRHLRVGNLFAYRATDHDALDHVRDPVGPENDSHLRAMSYAVDLIVAAWGVFRPFTHEDRDTYVMDNCLGPRVYHLGLTKHGDPRHPLYLRKDAPRKLYRVQ